MKVPSEIDTKSAEGLTRLFRFAIGLRDNDADRAALRRLEIRFGLAPYYPQFRGALEDFARVLDGLDQNPRFDAVFDLISGVLQDEERLDDALVDSLLQASSSHPIVRFSFTGALLPCLFHARKMQSTDERAQTGYDIRYSGVGSDKELMAFASLFMNLAIYTESGPPWDPNTMLDDGDPNSEPPDLEVSFPPADFRMNDAPHLEASVRATKLPRAVDRGKYDLESVMLEYLGNTEAMALAFTSEAFLSSTKQSRLSARQHLIEMSRIQEVAELTLTEPRRFLIELGTMGHADESIRMVRAASLKGFDNDDRHQGPHRRTSALIPINEIRRAGGILSPKRYLAAGLTGGKGISSQLSNRLRPSNNRLADYFEVTRPKATKNDPVGTMSFQEIGAGNISANGELGGPLRKITIRETLSAGLEEQVIKPGDILFAHKGPIGQVAFVMNTVVEKEKIWAAQNLLIFRPRKRTSRDQGSKRCDPRALFMYLLTPEIKESWAKFSTNDRSRAIPIGEIERFILPDNLLIPTETMRPSSSCQCSDSIISEFQEMQSRLLTLRKTQQSLNDGLERVWEIAWAKPASRDEL